MSFQNYIYTLYDEKDKVSYGVYATFKEAYELIESLNDDALAIIDNGDEKLGCSFFDVIRSYKYDFMNRRYIIMRNLLTVLPNAQTVSFEMVEEAKRENKKYERNNYKTTNDLM